MIKMIGTWAMALGGVEVGMAALKNGEGAGAAVLKAIDVVDCDDRFDSVGFGGLPDENGEVLVDGAYMRGDTLAFGAIASVHDVLHPARVAERLSRQHLNRFLVGPGALAYAQAQNFEIRSLNTETTTKRYAEKCNQNDEDQVIGHDTVCMIALDQEDHLVVATSTSGLFMKKRGRVGDTPVIGSGFYADDAYGACAATGVGEDIMKSCLSVRVVDRMAQGVEVQQALNEVFHAYVKRQAALGLTVDMIGLIAMDKAGNCGAIANTEFPYVIGSCDGVSQLLLKK